LPHLYDAHLHFHFAALTPHHAAIDADLRAAGLRRAVVNGTGEEEWPVVAGLAKQYAWILPSYGIHPWDCGNRSPDWQPVLRTQLEADPHAGVGEIGLDRWIIDGVKPSDPRIAGLRVAPMAEQCEVFAAQLALAAELNRAASIHCVQAFGILADVLRSTKLPARGFLLHGYGGPAEMIPEFARLGAYFSFNLQLLEPRLASRLENFRHIPADRLLVETDAPTKAPPPERNRFPLGTGPDDSVINHPANIAVAYEALAELRSMSLDALAEQVEKNFTRLFI
jgi:TatD DNase family protein